MALRSSLSIILLESHHIPLTMRGSSLKINISLTISASECINIINNIVYLMYAHRHSFIQWDSTCFKNPGEQRIHQQSILKGFPQTQIQAQSNKELQYLSERRIHSEFLDILPSKIHILKLMDYLIFIISHPIVAYGRFRCHFVNE